MNFDSKLFDHTILKADASREAVEKICKEALEYNFFLLPEEKDDQLQKAIDVLFDK